MALPPEIWSHIVSFIPIIECMNVLLINRQFYDIVHYLHQLLKKLNACDDKNKSLYIAAKGGYHVLVDYFLSKGGKQLEGLRGAAEGGHKHILNFLIEKGTKHSDVLDFTAMYGQIELVKYFLSQYDDFNSVLKGACRGNQVELIQFALNNGANNFHHCIRYCAKYGHLDLVKSFYEKLHRYSSFIDIRSTVRMAAKGGHYDIVLFLLEQGSDANSALRNAAREGHLDIVKLAIDKGAHEFSEAMICAIDKNHVHIIKFIGDKVKELYGE